MTSVNPHAGLFVGKALRARMVLGSQSEIILTALDRARRLASAPPRIGADWSSRFSYSTKGSRTIRAPPESRDGTVRFFPWLVCAPGAGQFSCGGFDSLPGVVILELCWA